MTDSLRLLVVNTQEDHPNLVHSRVLSDIPFDDIVLIPGMEISIDEYYDHYPSKNYSLYLRRPKHLQIKFVGRDYFCGMIFHKFKLMVLKVDADINEDFVRKLKSHYLNRTILVVHSRYPSLVFDIHIGNQDKGATITRGPTNYCVFNSSLNQE